MSADDRVRWDKIYRSMLSEPFPSPDPLLLQFTPPVEPDAPTPTALDLAAGYGQNGLWLAAQGYRTDIIDISRVALQRARAEMTMRNLRNINLLQIDLDELELDEESYDLICVFRYLRRDLYPQIKAAIKPGGRIIYETYNERYLEKVPAFNPKFLLELGEMANVFDVWNIVYYEEDDHNTRIVAVRPNT